MRLVVIFWMLFASLSAFAQVSPTSVEVEERARDVGRSLRCVVCQNQSIEESDAALAKDMRVLVRERMALGATDAEVIEFMRLRYGDYVLLKPPFQRNTYLLWIVPGLMVFGMGIWLGLIARKKTPNLVLPESLSDDERAVLNQLMDDNT